MARRALPPVAPSETLVDGLRFWAEQTPDETACAYVEDGDRVAASHTFASLERRARGIAAELQGRGLTGERALLLFPPGLEFVEAFYGCLLAGVVAVPSYPPHPNRPADAATAIAASARPAAVLTTARMHGYLAGRIEASPDLSRTMWLHVEELGHGLENELRIPLVEPSTVAVLQYTSGSLSAPKGAIVSHGNLVHNTQVMMTGFGWCRGNLRAVSWLPLHHDMGLVGHLLAPLLIGAPAFLLSPLDFLQQPVQWLRAISTFRGTHSTAPNFAYDLCVRRVSDAERDRLDLSCWTWAGNGSEPVRAETIERFAETFAPCGFERRQLFPCYGLAECTLYVSGGPRHAPPVMRSVSHRALEVGRIEPVDAADQGSRALVSSGRVRRGIRVAIVDPETAAVVPKGRVGEIWIDSPSVTGGYFEQREESEPTFGARLADDRDGTRYLRTGDLGFLDRGHLFITGRLKDLVIIQGRNHYPQDIERTVSECHEAIRPGCSAAFSVDAGDAEVLVVVSEVRRGALRDLDREAVIQALRAAVAEQHEIKVHQALLVKPGLVPKTSSGKIKRLACRELYSNGRLEPLGERDG
jgi:acyl-CoA synthetase (AMP-forming)/AMP-acid ligase II